MPQTPEKKREYYIRTRERAIARAKANYKKNREAKIAAAIEWRNKNWDKWYAKHRARMAARPGAQRTASTRWRKRHPAEKLADYKAYMMRKIHAMPPWADRAAIKAVYAEAHQRTRETGIQHHVDHIYPLRGKGFNGLHVPWNLQVITAAQNMSKGNRL